MDIRDWKEVYEDGLRNYKDLHKPSYIPQRDPVNRAKIRMYLLIVIDRMEIRWVQYRSVPQYQRNQSYLC